MESEFKRYFQIFYYEKEMDISYPFWFTSLEQNVMKSLFWRNNLIDKLVVGRMDLILVQYNTEGSVSYKIVVRALFLLFHEEI